jgi:hypothetical protein
MRMIKIDINTKSAIFGIIILTLLIFGLFYELFGLILILIYLCGLSTGLIIGAKYHKKILKKPSDYLQA